MTKPLHDTFVDLGRGTPVLFTLSAVSMPLLVAFQFLLAGQALFAGQSWDLHGMVGGMTALPVLILLSYSLLLPRLRGFGWWAAVVTVLYVLQLMLASLGAAALALHPFNAALLLTASVILFLKVERRRSAQSDGG